MYIVSRDIFGSLESEKVPKFTIFGQIWLNFGFKNVIFWLEHSVPIRPSAVKDAVRPSYCNQLINQ